MTDFKLALKNLLGAGMRTWLNVTVLSVAFVVILFYNGMLDGWNLQAKKDTRDWETAHGQLWHKNYNPHDPFTLQDAHEALNSELMASAKAGELAPVLIIQATAYPQGRMMNVLLKGIPPEQHVLQLPTKLLGTTAYGIPALVGKRMAATAGLKEGDNLMIRWRDASGTFDARHVVIAGIFDSNVPTIDNGQLWLPLDSLYGMTNLHNHATMLIAGSDYSKLSTGNWLFKDDKFLLSEIDAMIQAKKGGSSVMYIMLLAIALLAVFDTQILSIFRRQKEIGTYIALGMTRSRVVRMFTIEGSAHSLLAILLGCAWGIPLLLAIQKNGIPMPSMADAAGVSIASALYPAYSAAMILSTVILIIISATVVSYLPSRRISKMKPTEALKGKLI